MSDADEPEDLSAPPRHDTFLRQLARPVDDPAPALVAGTRFGGRYEIRRLVGVGGMGEVYLARDHTLERDVALKVHRGTRDAERTRREAVAMAQLAHPNVVTVFEAGEADGRGFVAMELVDGTTLRGWLAAAPRHRRERLAMLRAIGAGLAAAHAAGIVHLDFKPENVLVGRDGRPRVGDFGLARLAIDTSSTTAGTPAYMAPEQAAGLAVDARTDQFAFCVVAWEALYGARPWAAAARDEATARAEPAPPAAATRPVRQVARAHGTAELASGGGKGRVQRALVRGLAADPAARFPDLPTLLGELVERPPWLAIGLGAVGAGAAAVAVWQLAQPAPPSCERAGDELATALPDAYASEQLPAGYRARYRETARVACKARLDGAWSRALAAKATACLTIERTVAARVPDRDVTACADPTRLAGMPALTAAAVAARARLVVAEDALERREQDAAMQAVAAAAASDPRATRVRGRLALVRGDLATAQRTAEQAATAARAIADAETTLLAVGDVGEFVGGHRGDHAAFEHWLPAALADVERLSTQAPEAAARLYLLAARTTLADPAASDTDRPTAWLGRAFALLGETRPTRSRVEAHLLRAALADRSGRFDDAVRDHEQARALARARFGADHDEVARTAAAAALAHIERGRVEPAAEAAREAARILERPATDLLARVRARHALGLARLARGDHARGIAALRLARDELHALPASARGDLATTLAAIDERLALALVDTDTPAEAVALLDEQRALREAMGAPRRELATIDYNLGVARRDTGDLRAALASARSAVASFAITSRHGDGHRLALTLVAQIANRQGDHATALAATAEALAAQPSNDIQTLAWPRVERARALLATGGARAEIAQLLGEARALYAGLGMTSRLAEIATLEALLRRQ